MSDLDVAPAGIAEAACGLPGPQLRVVEPRAVPLGGIRAMTVTRTIPERSLPSVGAWCFLDEAGPQPQRMRVLPHPHIGLQTVSWLLDGAVHHRDSVGSDAVVRPGELNLMTSGAGIAHSEFTPGDDAEPLHLLQLWIALPESARHGAPHFEQHRDLPVVAGDGWRATVLIGAFAGARSPATAYSPLVGVEVGIEPDATVTLPVRADFEHAVLVPRGDIVIDGDADGDPADLGAELGGGVRLGRGPLCFLGGRRSSIRVRAGAVGATVLLIGGEPLGEDLVMWWNFVGRTHEEIVAARDAWEAGDARFGRVVGHGAERIPAPPLPAVRLTPRRRSG